MSLGSLRNHDGDGDGNTTKQKVPSSAKQQREMTNSALSGERGPRRLNFKIFISYLSLCFALSFEIV